MTFTLFFFCRVLTERDILESRQYLRFEPEAATQQSKNEMEDDTVELIEEIPPPKSPRYKVLEEIDEGGFGRIYKVRNSESNREFALKRLCYDGEFQDDKYIFAEVYCLSKLKHPNIIELEEFILKPERLYIIMEYAKCGNIEQYVIRNHPLPTSEILGYFNQIISAVCYCHSRNIAHRDLTPSNALLTEDFNIKLADWGLATPCGKDRDNPIFSEDFIGDSRYLPPEVLRRKPFSPLPTDVWGLGCVLFFMLIAEPPFEGTETSILNQQTGPGVIFPDWLKTDESPEIHLIVENIHFLLVANETKRPKAEVAREFFISSRK